MALRSNAGAVRFLWLIALGAFFCASGFAPKQPREALTIRLYVGEQIAEHVDMADRTAWILPKKRLSYFSHSGMTINEDKRVRTNARATVTGMANGVASLRGNVTTIVIDVPRHTGENSSAPISTSVSRRNENLPDQRLDLKDAAMALLPALPVQIGSRWITHQRVTTGLGSGDISLTHTVTHIGENSVEVDVSGRGAITGAEYNLPKLLPGTIALRGSAWYDLDHHIISHESYVIVNRIVRFAGAQSMGFEENESVEVTTSARKSF